MKLVFFGSSPFSLYALEACLASSVQLALVVTTPPQKKGRGLIETPTPVQLFAEENKLPWIAPENLKAPELFEKVQTLRPDFFAVSSYGKMIPFAWLKVPSRYALNVHPSLLPKYRGAAPINWPIILGDIETGVSIAEVTPALDAGDLFFQNRLPIPETADAVAITEILGESSRAALQEVLSLAVRGALKRVPQDHSRYNYARKLKKEDGRVDWHRSAVQIRDQVRGLLPWPAVSVSLKADNLQILKAAVILGANSNSIPGTITDIKKDAVWVQTGNGILALEKVKPSGKKEMSGGDYARGKRLAPGDAFTQETPLPLLTLSQSFS